MCRIENDISKWITLLLIRSPLTFSFPAPAPSRCIDYVFVRPNGRKVTVKETSIPQALQTADLATASDHLPVVLTVAIE